MCMYFSLSILSLRNNFQHYFNEQFLSYECDFSEIGQIIDNSRVICSVIRK